MKADRDIFLPASRSIPCKTSRESVTEVFSFIPTIILPKYYHAEYLTR